MEEYKPKIDENAIEKMPEWLKKCLSCKYSYKKKSDDDEICCRRAKFGKCEYVAHKEKGINKNV